MTKNLRYFCTLLLMAVVGVAWADVTDVLTPDVIGISGSSYTTWSGVTATSDAVYAGQSSAGTGIQLRSNGNNSGVVTTTSGGKVKSITVEWHNSTQNGRTLNVYGKNSAYTQATDLYGNNAGELLGTIVCGTNTTIEVEGDYEYIGLRSAGSAMYLNSITIVWDDGASSDAPSITTENVNIEYDATGGQIAYTIENEVEGGSVNATTTADWLTLSENFESPIAFTCDANTVNAARTATVTLTYSYGENESVTKDVIVTQAAYVPTVPGYVIDFENEASQYTDWTFTNMESKQTGNGNVTAHGGTYYGTTGGKASASITTKTKIATPYTLTCYVTKQSTNTTASNWKIEVSSDGDSWTSVKEQSATSMTAGTWVELTASLTSYTDVYVRVSYSGSTAVRNIDDLTLVTEIPTSPIINAENPAELTYDATSGEIAYTITNPVEGTLLQATADADWVSNIEVGAEAITFTTTANELKTERVATFTLTYEGAEDKIVTVTQAGNPNIIDKIENISESGVPYNVQGTVVATSARAFVIGDGTGFIYTYLGSAPSWSVGDMVKISGTTSSYNQVIQFPNSATITVATESEYTPMTPAAMTEVPDYTSGLYKSDYYQFEGMLTKEGNYYVVAVGEGQIRISYPSTSQTTELDALLNKMVKVNGFFAGNSANGSGVFTAIMESIEEVVSDEPSITLASYEVEVNANAHTTPTTIAVTYANIDLENDVPEVVFYEQDGSTEAIYNWLFVDLDTDWNVYYTIDEENTNNAARTAYFKVLGYDSNGNNVYSDLASITQAAPAPKYIATVASNISNGTVMIVDGTGEVEIIEVEEGTEVTLTATADAGYALGEWNVYKDGDETVKVTVSNNKFNMPAYDVIISATFVEATTYTLITSTDELVSGKRYVIAGVKNDVTYALGKEGTNNRPGVSVEISNNTITGNNDVCEVVIIGPDADGFYSLYDVAKEEYLYAAHSNSNYLKSQNPNDNNGRWTIEFEENAANIVAQGSNSRNIMRFNPNGNNNPLFSCYNGGQQPIYLYAKDNETTVSKTMTIDGYSNSTNPDGGYYLIASPFGQVTPTEANGFLTPDYDLYRFDQTQELEWRNYKQEPFNLVSGHGYLYANSGNVTLTFEGYPYVGSGQVFLVKDDNAEFAGWNLIGNPFNATATIPNAISYYTLNEDGDELAAGDAYSVEAMEGIFVLATATGQSVTFTQGTKADTESCPRLSLNLSSNGKLADRAIVRLGEGQTLPKFMLDESNTKLYFTEGNRDYAVVRSEAEGELPVNFKAKKKGTYTISVETNDIEAKHLHLIDNMTGIDIDLLATPSYTFEARTTDYASRFRLVFSANNVNQNAENDTFAYFNGSEWVINGSDNATVQVIDMMGRVVLSGTNTIATNDMQAGVYVIRLVDGNNVKTQKIVVE